MTLVFVGKGRCGGIWTSKIEVIEAPGINIWYGTWDSELGCIRILDKHIPYHPCMVYLPTFTIGKYTIHGWSGMGIWCFFDLCHSIRTFLHGFLFSHRFTTCCFSAGSTVFVGPFIKRDLDVLLGMILAWVRHQNTWSLGFKYGYCPKVTLLSTKGNKSHRILDILMGWILAVWHSVISTSCSRAVPPNAKVYSIVW